MRHNLPTIEIYMIVPKGLDRREIIFQLNIVIISHNIIHLLQYLINLEP